MCNALGRNKIIMCFNLCADGKLGWDLKALKAFKSIRSESSQKNYFWMHTNYPSSAVGLIIFSEAT